MVRRGAAVKEIVDDYPLVLALGVRVSVCFYSMRIYRRSLRLR